MAFFPAHAVQYLEALNYDWPWQHICAYLSDVSLEPALSTLILLDGCLLRRTDPLAYYD